MLTSEMVPREPERLAKLFVQMPALDRDSPQSCPVAVDELVGLVGEELEKVLRPDDLEFVRTAAFDEVEYWVWRVSDVADGAGAWIVVSVDADGDAALGCMVDRWGFTAAQAIVGEHFGIV